MVMVRKEGCFQIDLAWLTVVFRVRDMVACVYKWEGVWQGVLKRRLRLLLMKDWRGGMKIRRLMSDVQSPIYASVNKDTSNPV
jgi:hypothetical protein